MSAKPTISRISITIPADLLAEADRLAAELDRSRSWVMGEAVRRWIARPPTPAVREPAVSPYPPLRPGLGEQRLSQLHSDMRLTVEQRVMAAEEANKLDRAIRPPIASTSVRFFDRYEDYLAWKKFEGIRA